MILVDTSVWVDHLRTHDNERASLLGAGMVLTHPFIIGDLALGHVVRRERVPGALLDLPSAVVATDAEVLLFIERHALFGRGAGYLDTHVLAAVRLTAGAAVWTRDERLEGIARGLGLAVTPPARAVVAMARLPPNLALPTRGREATRQLSPSPLWGGPDWGRLA